MTVSTPPRRGFFNNRRVRQEALAAYLFLLPYLIVTLVFTVGVILFAFYISFNQFNLYTWPPEWVGLDNYVKALSPKGQFVRSLVNVIWYVISSNVSGSLERMAYSERNGPAI